MTTLITHTEESYEGWLREQTYHAILHNGEELSVVDFTRAMKQTTDITIPLPAWQEVSQAEARTLYQKGTPIILYNKHTWKHASGSTEPWSANRHMHSLIVEHLGEQSEATSGTTYAICYLDSRRGNFSNASWRAEFIADPSTFLYGTSTTIAFLAPSIQFPYTTHYTVIDAHGNSNDYANSAAAIQGFQALPSQDTNDQSATSPQFSYYHEVTCPGGTYRLEFFGSHVQQH
jgi:hypothetical protein